MVYLAKALEPREGDRERLELLTRGKSSSAALALRARTVLLAADGLPNIQIEKSTGFSAPTVLKRRVIFLIIGGTVKAVSFLLWVAPILLVIAIVVFLMNRSRGRRGI